jgi:hypothetical protein
LTARSFAYAVARFLGDVNAVRRGKIGKRLVNRLIGRTLVSRMWLR